MVVGGPVKKIRFFPQLCGRAKAVVMRAYNRKDMPFLF
jgi:hypothetical protein